MLWFIESYKSFSISPRFFSYSLSDIIPFSLSLLNSFIRSDGEKYGLLGLFFLCKRLMFCLFFCDDGLCLLNYLSSFSNAVCTSPDFAAGLAIQVPNPGFVDEAIINGTFPFLRVKIVERIALPVI